MDRIPLCLPMTFSLSIQQSDLWLFPLASQKGMEEPWAWPNRCLCRRTASPVGSCQSIIDGSWGIGSGYFLRILNTDVHHGCINLPLPLVQNVASLFPHPCERSLSQIFKLFKSSFIYIFLIAKNFGHFYRDFSAIFISSVSIHDNFCCYCLLLF